MARVEDHERGTTWTEPASIARELERFGLRYRRVGVKGCAEASDAELLAAYAAEIEAFEREGGYVAADVVSVTPETPGIEALLARFGIEHTHAEDEVRLVAAGRGKFWVHPRRGPVLSIEVEAGDAISVPRGMPHWFHLCQERRIRAVRLFQDVKGWTPEYTGSGAEARFAPLCFGAPRLA